MISNINPNSKDVVILQRNDANTYYGETHISGSDLILYIDSDGHVNADNSSSFYTLFPPTSTSQNSDSSSWASSSLSSSHSDTSSYLLYSGNNNGTSSFSITSSFAATASYVYGTSSFAETASYAVSASYEILYETSSSYSDTSSYLNVGANIYLSQSYIVTTNTSSAVPSYQPAQLYWDNNAKTYAMTSDHAGVSLQIGQEQWIRGYAHEYIPNGSPVYVHDSIGGLPCFMLALADGVVGSTKSEVVGLATENIISGSIGIITSQGQIHDVDTSLFTEGQSVYLSNENSGSIISSYPSSPYEVVQLGYVLVSNPSNGIIQVNITNVEQNSYPFVGMTSLPSVVTGSLGLVTIGTGSVNLSITTDGSGPIKNYGLPSASFTVNTSSLDAQYIVATYNSGSPIYQLETDKTLLDEIQTTLVYTLIYRIAPGILSVIDWDSPGNLLPNKIIHRITDVNGIERSSGLILGISGSRYSTISSGSVWNGSSIIQLIGVNSGINRLVQVVHSASVWSSSLITQLTNTQCDNGINVVGLGSGNNHWVSNYIYRGCGNQNTHFVMYSNDYGSLTDAKLGQPPATPSEFLDTTILVGRVIYQKNAATPDAIESAFTTTFADAGASVHNDLTGLQGGTPGEYYHLTSASYSQVTSGTSSYTLTASYLIGYTPPTLVTASISSSWASSSLSASYLSGSDAVVNTINPSRDNNLAISSVVDSSGFNSGDVNISTADAQLFGGTINITAGSGSIGGGGINIKSGIGGQVILKNGYNSNVIVISETIAPSVTLNGDLTVTGSIIGNTLKSNVGDNLSIISSADGVGLYSGDTNISTANAFVTAGSINLQPGLGGISGNNGQITLKDAEGHSVLVITGSVPSTAVVNGNLLVNGNITASLFHGTASNAISANTASYLIGYVAPTLVTASISSSYFSGSMVIASQITSSNIQSAGYPVVNSPNITQVVSLTTNEYASLTPTASVFYIITDSTLTGSVYHPISNINSNYAVTTNDYTLNVLGAYTITLITAVGNGGMILNIKNSATSGNVTVNAAGAELIDGVNSWVVNPKSNLTIQSTNSNWIIL